MVEVTQLEIAPAAYFFRARKRLSALRAALLASDGLFLSLQRDGRGRLRGVPAMRWTATRDGANRLGRGRLRLACVGRLADAD